MAPREDERAMEGLLRRNLAPGADSAGVCPESDILAAYFERSLDADEIERHELHFSRCARCREQLAALARAAVPAGAGAGVGSLPTSSPRLWFWNWRWLAVPAAAILAFAIVGFLHEHAGKQVALQAPASPPVALEKPEAQPSESVAPRLDEKKREVPPVATAQKPSRGFYSSVPERAARVTSRNVLSLKAPTESDRDKNSEDKRVDKEALTDAIAKAAARQEPMSTSAKMDAPQSANQTVEVSSAAPAVPAPAPPPVSANAVSGGQAGANEGTGSPALATNGANVQELESIAPRKKSKREAKAEAAVAQTDVTSAMTDSTQLTTIGGQLSPQMILTPDPAILWRFAGAGFVERSTDGGATWQGEEPSVGGQLVAGAAPSANVCWIVGRSGLILLTKDAKSWKKISPPADTDFVAVSAESAPNATVTTADGRKFATRDGGKKWKPAE